MARLPIPVTERIWGGAAIAGMESARQLKRLALIGITASESEFASGKTARQPPVGSVAMNAGKRRPSCPHVGSCRNRDKTRRARSATNREYRVFPYGYELAGAWHRFCSASYIVTTLINRGGVLKHCVARFGTRSYRCGHAGIQ